MCLTSFFKKLPEGSIPFRKQISSSQTRLTNSLTLTNSTSHHVSLDTSKITYTSINNDEESEINNEVSPMATKQRKRKSLKRKKSSCSPASRIKKGRKTTPLKGTPNKLSIGQQTLDIPNKTTPKKLSLLLPSTSLESKQFVSPSLEQTPELFSSCESDHTRDSISVKNTYTSPGFKKTRRTLFTEENDKGLVEKVGYIRKNIATEKNEFDEIKRSDKHFIEVGELKSSGDEEEMAFLKDLRLSDIEDDSDQSDVFPLSHDCYKQTSEFLSCIPRRFQVVKCFIQDCTSGQPNGWYVLKY